MKKIPLNPMLPGRLGKLTAEEMDAEVARFDREIDMSKLKPLTPAMRREWNAWKRRGRPKVGAGAERISVTMERQLLSRADAYARAKGMTRSQLIQQGVKVILSKAG
jgi:hypothetical protein